MDDAALVEAARGGDGSAWGAIYDRYADRLHDHCHRILRDRDEAADALHDAFVAAARNLHQLRDPARLRPWLYAICRHEALRHAEQRGRVELTGEADDVKGVDMQVERGAEVVELQELVWSAAAGLSARDQALLDLNLRQGLEGQDLADAMGTSLDNSYVMLSRLRDQVERSLGALLIARLGREECDELDALLAGWDGRFSTVLRKRVARHVDGCDVCRERRAALVSPLALLAAMPLVPAPSVLRERVLAGVTSDAPAPPVRFTEDGFAEPAPAMSARSRARSPWWLAAAGLVVAAVLGAIVAADGGDDVPVAATSGTTSSSIAPVTSTTSTTSTSQAPSISVSILPTSTTSAPQVAPPTVDPGGPTTTDDPSVQPPPDTTPPAIASLVSEHPEIRTEGSSCPIQTSTITAAVTGADTVVLRWSGAPLSGSIAMSRNGGVWQADLGPFDEAPTDLTLDYTVEARDAAGNVARRTATIMVTPC
jgi:RNA polymerase sigma factor (sigma-70 family)